MKTILVLMLGLFAVSTFARPFPSSSEMRENFKTCLRENDSFYTRFGQYLVAYSYYEAQRECNDRNPYGLSTPRLMGCRTAQGWLTAGYYCEEILN